MCERFDLHSLVPIFRYTTIKSRYTRRNPRQSLPEKALPEKAGKAMSQFPPQFPPPCMFSCGLQKSICKYIMLDIIKT